MITLHWILISLTLLTARAQFIIDPYQFTSSGGYTMYTATFDGSNDYASRTFTAGITNFASGKTVTISAWIKMDGGDAASQFIVWRGTSGGLTRLLLERTTTNNFRLLGRSSGGLDVINAATSVTKVAADGWFHLLWWVDTAVPTNKVYFNRTEDTSLTTTTLSLDGIIELAGTGSDVFRVGAGNAGGAKLNGTLGDTLIYDVTATDPDVFVSAGGMPVLVGATGSTPTGLPPSFYFSSNPTWVIDTSGNANSITNVTGSLVYGTYP